MTYIAITDAETAPGKPVTEGLMDKIQGDLSYLYGTLGSMAAANVPNGSFEIDSDGDGTPDSWGMAYYPGGSGALYTTSPAHGAQAWSFVHPGGAGNGGGYGDTDYIEISQLVQLWISFDLWATVAGMKNMVQVRYFDKDKAYVSDATLHTSTTNPTSATEYLYTLTPVATARYLKIRIIGGYTDTDVAGTIYFDNVRIGAIVAASVTQTKLATSTSEVSSVAAARATITGGSYCLQNNSKMGATGSAAWIAVSGVYTGSFNGWSTYRNEVYIEGTGVTSAYMQSRYITASGEVPWVFVMRNKSTGIIIATSNAVDHVCFGAGGNPIRLPHPWTSSVRTDETNRNWFKAVDGEEEIEVELICINPDKDDYYAMIYDCIQKDQGFAGLIFGREIDVWNDKTGKFQKEPAYNLSIAREGVKKYPTKAVTVGLPIEVALDPYGWMASQKTVRPIKKIIPQPKNIIVAELE